MNNIQEQVSGVVQGVGDNFNGSVKVNGVWYSNRKGFKNTAVVGDQVTLTLEAWEAKGKKGLNIVNVGFAPKPVSLPKVLAEKLAPKTNPKSTDEGPRPGVATVEQLQKAIQGRDYDAENRGKVRHGLTVALVSLVATDTITLEQLKEVVNSLVPFVMEG